MASRLTFLTIAVILLIGPGLALQCALLSNSAVANEMKKDSRENTTPPARDPKLAVEEEYQLARQQGTVQSLELFIARHPNDPLAEKARSDLRRFSQ
jgi:hypothetical protein